MDENPSAQQPALNIGDVSDLDERSMASEDKEVMAQMGKRQVLQRRFNIVTIFGLALTLISSWEALAGSLAAALVAGGPVSLVYGLVFTFTGTLACAASIAEMASICPISGAQYHWTFMFSPKRYRTFITFVQGWVTVFAWQAAATSMVYLLAGQLLGLAILNDASYVPQLWHTTLLMWAAILVSLVLNIWGIGLLPLFELFSGVLHVTLFVCFCIIMVVMGRNAKAEFVFTKYVNETGWESNGVAWFMGLLPSVYCIVGFDGAIHLSEETSRSATVIPKVIVSTVILNSIMAWIFMLLCLFSISDVAAVLGTSTGFPFIEIMQQATRSRQGATAMVALTLSITLAATIGIMAGVSRLTWSFARDDGLPFSSYFKHVDPRYKVPMRAVCLMSVIMILLSLVNIGSSVALNAILSLTTIALYASYTIPITCLIFMRLRVKTKIYDSKAGHAEISQERLVFGPWNLGKWGMLINVYGVCYAVLLVPFMALPTSLPLTQKTMNYAGPIFGLVLCFSCIDYLARGKKFFVGPRRER